MIQQWVPRGRILEIGAGTGAFLAMARDEGFEPHGVELSVAGVEYAREVYGLESIQEGSFDDATYPGKYFDIVYAWHVIEHVADLDRFVTSIHRVLKPNGLLWIGTENYREAWYYTSRLSKLVHGLPPPFATSDDHTFAFTSTSLNDVVQRRGFRTYRINTYQPPLANKVQSMSFRSPVSLSYFLAMHMVNELVRTGPLLRLIARRNAGPLEASP